MAKIDGSILSELMIKTQAGDKRSYAELLHAIEQILTPYLYKRIFDKAAIDDILQIILIAVDKAKATYKPDAPFLPWLYAIAQYKIVDYIRTEERKNNRETEFEPISETFSSFESNKEAEDAIELIHKALETLADKPKKVVTLLKIEGYNLEEVANKMGLSKANIKIIAHRAYKDMRTTIEKLDK